MEEERGKGEKDGGKGAEKGGLKKKKKGKSEGKNKQGGRGCNSKNQPLPCVRTLCLRMASEPIIRLLSGDVLATPYFCANSQNHEWT